MEHQGLDQLIKDRTGVTHRGSKAALALPPDLLEQAVGRLTIVIGLFALLMTGSIVFNTLLYYTVESVPLPPLSLALRGAGLVASLAMLGLLRSGRLSDQRKCDIGLVFEVFGAGAIVGFELSMLPALDMPIGHLSYAALWILLFRLIVPTPPLKALVAALTSASAVPVVVWIIGRAAIGPPVPPVSNVLYVTTFSAALVAVVVSVHIYRLSTAVTEARRLGSYHLEELLGAGGMGEVWRGSHARLKRPAAIKLIKPEQLGAVDEQARATALQRFEREAQATAELGSAHTVTVYDFGRTGDGTFYLVMELLDGFDLETLVEEHGALPPERAAFLLKQVCHSLMDAHARGLVHRDVKPANIFACQVGQDVDYVKVLDFGLVKHIKTEESDDQRLTGDNVVTGTPAFMPPEVALGSAPTGEKSDIYSLGCVAYWLLTGTLFFEGANVVAVISNHIHATPEPLSKRAPGAVPEALETLVMDCLEKDPADRPASVAALWERFDSLGLDAAWTHDRALAWWDEHHRSG